MIRPRTLGLPVLRLMLLLTATVGCQNSGVKSVPGGFGMEEDLDLGPVPVGERVHRELALISESRRTQVLTFRTEPPFGTEVDTVELQAGAKVVLRVWFQSTSLGTAEGGLRVLEDQSERSVRLRAEGIAPCASSGACQVSEFDPTQGLCVEAAEEDGTPCATTCIEAGLCAGGACAGTFLSCDDQDPCTMDVCSPQQGCVHLPRQCPIEDPCQVVRCDPALGCVGENVADGTACGPASCATALICIDGQCVTRSTPNAELDCTYTAVCAGPGYACASTRSERLRCWGSGEALGLPTAVLNPVVSPAFLPGATQVVAPLCGSQSEAPRWLTTAGTIGPDDPFDAADAGMAPLVKAVPFSGFWLGLDSLGAARRVRSSEVVTLAEVDAQDVFPGLCVLHGDGTVRCDGFLFFSAPPSAMAWARFRQYGLFDGGRVEGWAGESLVDGGATALGGTGELICWAKDQEVTCVDPLDSSSPRRISWPEPVAALTHVAATPAPVCGLATSGSLTCWGENRFGETSDRSALAEAPVRFGDGGFSSIALAGGHGTLALRGWEVVGAGFEVFGFDGQPAPRDRDAGESAVVSLGQAPGATAVGSGCLLQVGELRCWGYQLPLRTIATGVVRACGASPCGIDSLGRRVCMNPLGTAEVTGSSLPDDESSCSRRCHLSSGGTVTCHPSPGTAVPVDLPGPASQLTGEGDYACALAGGQVHCWHPGNGVATKIAGARTPVRLLRAGGDFACAVSGENGVQCWGADGAVEDHAVTHPIADLRVGGSRVGVDGEFSRMACLLFTDGEVSCWGANWAGQLGFVPNKGQHAVLVTR